MSGSDNDSGKRNDIRKRVYSVYPMDKKKKNSLLTWSPSPFCKDLMRGIHCALWLKRSSSPFGIFMLTQLGIARQGSLFTPQSVFGVSSVSVTSWSRNCPQVIVRWVKFTALSLLFAVSLFIKVSKLTFLQFVSGLKSAPKLRGAVLPGGPS